MFHVHFFWLVSCCENNGIGTKRNMFHFIPWECMWLPFQGVWGWMICQKWHLLVSCWYFNLHNTNYLKCKKKKKNGTNLQLNRCILTVRFVKCMGKVEKGGGAWHKMGVSEGWNCFIWHIESKVSSIIFDILSVTFSCYTTVLLGRYRSCFWLDRLIQKEHRLSFTH